MRNIPNWAIDVRVKMYVYGIQQTQLSKKVGISRETLNRILLGVVPCSDGNRDAILAALDQLIAEKEEP